MLAARMQGNQTKEQLTKTQASTNVSLPQVDESTRDPPDPSLDVRIMALSGTIKVLVAGTRVQAAHKGNARSLVFKARHGNVGDCYVGASDVSSAAGMVLAPGEAIQVQVNDPVSTSQFWADAANANDQVDFLGLE